LVAISIQVRQVGKGYFDGLKDQFRIFGSDVI